MKNKILLAVLAIALVLGMTACRSDGGETDTWTNVTSYSQLNGTWKGSGTYTATEQGITHTNNIYNMTLSVDLNSMRINQNGTKLTVFSPDFVGIGIILTKQ